MGELRKGSEAAKEVGVALAVLYNHIRAGRVTNRLAGGWPNGKGIEVDMDEVRAAVESSKAKREGKAPRAPRGSRKDKEAIQHALEEESYERSRKRAKEQTESGDNPHAVKLKRQGHQEKLACPVDPSHGYVETFDKSKSGEPRWICYHQAHDGRGTSTVGGYSPQTLSIFTREELNTPQPAGRLGVIMLEWITNGREDLAEDLENWLVEHDLPVWIPVRG